MVSSDVQYHFDLSSSLKPQYIALRSFFDSLLVYWNYAIKQ